MRLRSLVKLVWTCLHTKGLVFLPVEISVRESASSAMLASFLASKGLTVVIGGQAEVRRLGLGMKGGGAYLDKTLYSAHHEFYEILSKNNIAIFCDDVEALGCHVPDLYARARFSQTNINLCSGIFFWGSNDYDAIRKFYDFDESKAIRIGSFRAYYWKNYATKLEENLAKKKMLLQRFGRFVFVPSNFGGSMRPDGLEGVLTQAETNYPSLLPQIKKRLVHVERRRKEFVSAINRLVDDFPEVNFVFRPHPNEEVKKWYEEFPPKENFFLEYQGTVTEYVMAAAVVLHSGCTSAFEAFFYQVPCVAYVPNRHEKWDSWQANSLSIEAEEYSQLVTSLRESLDTSGSNSTPYPLYDINGNTLEKYYEVLEPYSRLVQPRAYALWAMLFRYMFTIVGRKLRGKSETKEDRKFSEKDASTLINYITKFSQHTDKGISTVKFAKKLILVSRDGLSKSG